MRIRNQSLIVLAFLLPCLHHGQSLTFQKAVDLALNHYTEAAHSQERCPVDFENSVGLARQFASANEQGLQPEDVVENQASNEAFLLQSKRSVILCAALLYADLDTIQTKELALNQQQDFVGRLMDIETKRVSRQVDPPISLTQAKLLRARTHMESVALAADRRKTQSALSVLLELPPGQITPVIGSMPLLPENSALSAEKNEVLKQLLAWRDIAQLDYLSQYSTRLIVTRDLALAKANIGNLVAAHITELMKFIALLQINSQVNIAKIQSLGLSDDLETWAFTPIQPSIQSAQSQSIQSSPNSTAGAPTLISLLLTPTIKEVPVGKSQQFSAIATYSDAHAKDVTTEATWHCSTDTGAVLSSTGLLTGLSEGPISIQINFQNSTQSRNLSITGQLADEYLLPNQKH